MKLVTFGPVGDVQSAILRADGMLVPLRPLLMQAGLQDMGVEDLLERFSLLRRPLDAVLPHAEVTVAANGVRLGPPLPRPGTVIVTGANYHAHIAEASNRQSMPEPSHPLLYLKPSHRLAGPNDAIVLPRMTSQLDYEIELGVVVGRGGRDIPVDEALRHVGGYVICNDLSARDIAMADAAIHPFYAQVTRSKAIVDSPTGPWLVTPDDLPDPGELELRCWVSGELRQSANTRDMIFDVATLIADFSAVFELRPGDLIMTGTPAGSGAGLTPPAFLHDGDVVRAEITGLGVMETPVVGSLVSSREA